MDDALSPHLAVGQFLIAMHDTTLAGHFHPAVLEEETLRGGSGVGEVEVIALAKGRCLVVGQVVSAQQFVAQGLFHTLFLAPPVDEREDALGLDKIYIQAKRYTDNPVSKPEIHKFIGALDEQKASKGVFITTSKFTAGAKETAEKASKKIVLIDGKSLADYMIEYNVGVSEKKVYEVKSWIQTILKNNVKEEI